jgi:two-component system cell cycle response regulator
MRETTSDDSRPPGRRARRNETGEDFLRRRALALAEGTGDGLVAHARRVAELAALAADALALDARTRRDVEATALLHDVGKTTIPREILSKPAALDDAEWALMRTHTIEGERIVNEATGVPLEIARMVRASHERWDGKGYPDGLSGRRIPLAARVVFCADAFDAMISERPYRPPLDVGAAVVELRRSAGRQFDPTVVEALASRIESKRGYGPPFAAGANGAPMA